jgi:hypothetical protein
MRKNRSAASRNQSEDDGWKRPEISQGNDCQGNDPEPALFHSPDKHSPDFGFFRQDDGPGIFPEMRTADALPCSAAGRN